MGCECVESAGRELAADGRAVRGARFLEEYRDGGQGVGHEFKVVDDREEEERILTVMTSKFSARLLCR
jgi:hypothetical protein